MSDRPVTPSVAGESSWRWVIIGLIFFGTLINMIDRQTISVLGPVIRHDLGLTNTQYGTIGSAFLFTYALSMWLWGAVFDRLGNRLGFSLAIIIWSVSEIGHGFARGLGSLSLMRGLLGIGEAGNWPGATRTIAVWFSPRQRALGMGIANTGASLGPAIAPPIIVWLQLTYGWKTAFVATGAIGFIWLAAWLALYPKTVKGGVPNSGSAPVPTSDSGRIPWPVLMRRREVWGIILARFFGDPVWWLYLNWLANYLSDIRHFSLKQIGVSSTVPYFFAALGAMCGGWLSSSLIHRGWSVNRARKTAIIVGTVLMPAGVLGAYTDSAYVALASFSVTVFAFQFWVGNVQTLPSDFFPTGAVGSIAGFAGTAAGLGAMLFTYTIGWVVDHFSYTPILITAGLLGPIATLTLFILIGRIRSIELFSPPSPHV
jgi:ACS family hexuronate transporter-like MFS transporter